MFGDLFFLRVRERVWGRGGERRNVRKRRKRLEGRERLDEGGGLTG